LALLINLCSNWKVWLPVTPAGELCRSGETDATAESAGQPWSPRALAAVRDTVDGIYGRYLQRRGKRRWCDKSLGAQHEAELAAWLYPEAKFICLYRHCMDVIGSGVEACPWGLHRFGLDGFAAQNPGNSVTAIGSYWLATVQSTMAFEERHPDACHRVRYEDLVTAPEETVATIFSFLGEVPVPDIAAACFQAPHEGNGPGDEEIWFTGGITADSVGGGVRVPAAALVPQVRQAVNQVLARLGYRTVDDEWNAMVGRLDMRADAFRSDPATSDPATSDRATEGDKSRRHEEPDTAVCAIEDRLRSRSDHDLVEASIVWPTVAGQTVTIIVEGTDSNHAELRWTFAAPPGGPHGPAGPPAGGETVGQPACTIIAGPSVWHALLSGEANLVTEMTAGRLRCVNRRDAHRIRSDEVHAIGWLLGLTRVPLVP
jgi:Sulfotransferase family